MKLGRWESARPLFAIKGRRLIAGISGGSTSAMMAALMDEACVMSFQNTGREARRTYDFLEELDDALGRRIVWLEYRPPERAGGRPCEQRFAVVSHKTADRSGGPFEMMMEALNAFRAANGKGPIAPWWKHRICTAYMKLRTSRKHAVSLGWTTWSEAVGLRADEPKRLRALNGKGHPKHITTIAPLADAGITKSDVGEFWDAQTFRLGLPEYMGNCVGCFLKDQSDVSRAMGDEEGDLDWWDKMETNWPMFGGRDFYGYKALAAELPVRLSVEAALRGGLRETNALVRAVPNDGDRTDRRHRLVVIQERKRFLKQLASFACGCEGSDTMAATDPEEEDQMILNLPEAA